MLEAGFGQAGADFQMNWYREMGDILLCMHWTLFEMTAGPDGLLPHQEQLGPSPRGRTQWTLRNGGALCAPS